MKQLDLRKGKKVLNSSMVQKKEENKFYERLEKQFKELEAKDKTLIRKPSKAEII